MRKSEVVLTVVVPANVVRSLEQLRRRRMREAGGHIPRSELIREGIVRLLEGADGDTARSAAGVVGTEV